MNLIRIVITNLSWIILLFITFFSMCALRIIRKTNYKRWQVSKVY